jgi:hypothetical protein
MQHNATKCTQTALTILNQYDDQYRLILTTVDGLIAERESWDIEDKTVKESLYSILTRCYRLFLQLNANTKPGRKNKHAFECICTEKGYRFRESTHLMTKVVTLVFGVNKNRTRKYALAMRIATKNGISPDGLASYFIDLGGIDEVISTKNNNGLTRLEKGKAAIYGDELARLSKSKNKKLLSHFNPNDYEDAVLFLATQDDEGNFVIHRLIQNKTAIKAAFVSVASSVSDSEINAMNDAQQCANDDSEFTWFQLDISVLGNASTHQSKGG